VSEGGQQLLHELYARLGEDRAALKQFIEISARFKRQEMNADHVSVMLMLLLLMMMLLLLMTMMMISAVISCNDALSTWA